ncbi:hypothetical protein [Planctomicrobium piriforme]|uniref:Uncharacterized protein n=1 Tax=Planctomicrobium piriforme TaxID=1576369 RepID=A0A1I3R965_9PLAN|nr:hypothetical protein [Planctomicrobium piriforme]SFJ41887.1 hypothetical protein SAMN05421753_12020 [Planctomicrobium piriforme]
MHATKPTILEQFLEHCQRPSHKLLGFLEPDADVWTLPQDPAAVVEELKKTFATVDLISSGLVCAAKEGSLVLVPAISNGACIVVCRDAATLRPFELLTASGCLDADALPVLEVLRDARTRRLLQQGTGDLVAAFDLEQVVLLRACGIPATLAYGLNAVPLEQLDQLCKSFDLSWTGGGQSRLGTAAGAEHGQESEDHPDDPIRRLLRNKTSGGPALCPPTFPPAAATPLKAIEARLAVLGWMPLELANAVPLPLRSIIDHFQQLERFLGFDMQGISLWEADEEMIARLKFIANSASAAIFIEALHDAADEGVISLTQFGKPKPEPKGPANDYSTALAQLHERAQMDAGHGMSGARSLQEAWCDYQRLLNQQVIDPLRAEALAAGTSQESNLLMAQAELSHLLHLQAAALTTQLHCRREEQLPAEQFKNLMATTDRFVSVVKATVQCGRPKTAMFPSRTLGAQNFPRLPRFG